MFNEEKYNYLVNKYRQLQTRIADDIDEWERFKQEEDKIRLQIYDLLVGNLSFDEVKKRLITKGDNLDV